MATGSKKSPSGGRFLTIGGVVSLLVAAVVVAFWIGHGAHMVTQYQVQVTSVEEDEFGDEIETKEMVDQFRFGLLPDRGYDGAAPLAGAFGVLGAGLLFVSYRRRKKEKSADG